MAGHQQQGSDMGAAFAGLIGGVIFIGTVLYAVVMWTNTQFESHKAEATHSAVSGSAPRVG
jgi:hypothetical protein